MHEAVSTNELLRLLSVSRGRLSALNLEADQERDYGSDLIDELTTRGAEAQGYGYRVRTVHGKSKVSWTDLPELMRVLDNRDGPLSSVLFPSERTFCKPVAEGLVRAHRIPEDLLTRHREVAPGVDRMEVEKDKDYVAPVPLRDIARDLAAAYDEMAAYDATCDAGLETVGIELDAV